MRAFSRTYLLQIMRYASTSKIVCAIVWTGIDVSPNILSCRVRVRSYLGTRYMGKQLKTSHMAGNELVPRMTKYTASGNLAFRNFFQTYIIRFLDRTFGSNITRFACNKNKLIPKITKFVPALWICYLIIFLSQMRQNAVDFQSDLYLKLNLLIIYSTAQFRSRHLFKYSSLTMMVGEIG